jgi:hypothetical protein
MSLRRTVLVLASSFFATLASPLWAQTAGSVLNLSGPLFAVKVDGARQVLSVGSTVASGDTLITEEKTYARIKFSDGSEVTMRPGTQFKIENYAYAQAEPAKDNAVFSLFKGALRAVTGLVGKRGNQDAYKMSTPTATIGIRGTLFIAEFIPERETAVSESAPVRAPYALPLLASADLSWYEPNQQTLTDAPAAWQPTQLLLTQLFPSGSPGGGGLAPGLYVHVIDGLIQLSNRGGVQQFAAGQFGFTGSVVQPPVIVPNNPGIQFNPPPAFNPSGNANPGPTGPSGQGNRTPPPPQDGCEVR